MLATALRSLILLDCEGDAVGDIPEIVAEFPLEGQASSLGWEVLSQRIVVAVNGSKFDRLCFCDAGDESLEDVSLPSGARALDLSFFSDADRRKSWVAVACSDGAVRLVDTSPQRAASVVRTSYAHGVEATAVAISHEGKFLASGSASGHVVLQPLHGSGPSPLPGMLEADEAGIEALCYSSLRQELLAASDEQGNLQVWDATALRHSCRFPLAHGGPVRGLSFSTQNSDLLISGGDDAQLSFWDVKNAKQIQQVSVESGISALSYHSGGYLLAAGTSEGSMLLFDLRMLVAKTSPAEPMQRFAAHAEDGGALRAISFTEEVKVPKAAFSPSGTGALSPAGDPVKSFLQEKVPSYATIESMMERLSKRVSVAEDVLTSPVDLNSAPTSDMSRSSFTWPSVPAQVPPLPSNERSSLIAPNIPETPQDARQVARYSIGSPADEPIVTSSPWWKQVAEMSAQEAKAPLATEATNLKFEAPEAPPATAAAPTAGGGAATAAAPTAVVEALKPLLMELRKDFRNEVQEAQLALMEQNFQLHSQLRKDVDALRAEVEQMRGELRQLK